MNKIEGSNNLVVVFTTESNSESASKLAQALLQDKLVACVSFNQISSLPRRNLNYFQID